MIAPLHFLLDLRLPSGGRVAVAQSPSQDAAGSRVTWSAPERDSASARRLASMMLEQELGWTGERIALEPVRCAAGCRYCGSIGAVAGLQVSLSHSRGLVAAAFSNRRIGVDLESLGVRPQPAIAVGRSDFWGAWTRDEAMWKAKAAVLCGSAGSDAPRVEIVLRRRDARFVLAVAMTD